MIVNGMKFVKLLIEHDKYGKYIFRWKWSQMEHNFKRILQYKEI